MPRQKQSENRQAKKQDGGTNIGKLVGRTVVYGLLAALVVVGIMEFRIRGAANSTGMAWREAFRKANDGNDDLLASQLEPFVEGKPKKETRKAVRMGDHAVAAIVTYTWNGILRDYKIYVGLGLGKDPSVEVIDGPGVPDPLAGQ